MAFSQIQKDLPWRSRAATYTRDIAFFECLIRLDRTDRSVEESEAGLGDSEGKRGLELEGFFVVRLRPRVGDGDLEDCRSERKGAGFLQSRAR